MDIRIDYLTYTEQVNISNDSTDKVAWKSLYSFICDYLPMSVVSYSDWSITFPWRYFLSIKGFVGQYFSARHNQYRVVFTDNARSMLKTANDTSYNTALALNARSEAEIKAHLESIGFKRSLTINQLNNLKKISHLPGAATFSVPGAGKTTEALAFFFVNATDIDRLLVVAPKNAFSAWDEQLDACMGENYGKFVRLRGGEAAIQIALRTNPRFMLITYAIQATTEIAENLPFWKKKYKEWGREEFKTYLTELLAAKESFQYNTWNTALLRALIENIDIVVSEE